MRRRGSRPTLGRANLVLAIVAAICLAPRAGGAQDLPPKVVVDIGDCVGVKSRDERLACFDRHVEAAKPNPETSPAPQTSAAEPPTTPTYAVAPAPISTDLPPAQAPAASAIAAAPVAAAASPAAAITVAPPAQAPPVATSAAAPPAPSSGTSAQSASAPDTGHNSAPQGDAKVKKPSEIVAIVTELHEAVPNAWLITLDNGQVWRQSSPQRFALKTGQRVTLRSTKWGVSYRLSADTLNGFIQVERVR
jgi:hypothetical protein